MTEVGIRALKQNASAVVAQAAAGERVTITDRGRRVAQLTPIPSSRVEQLVEAGQARRARYDVAALPAPRPGPDLSGELAAQRDAERYWLRWEMAFYLDTSALVKLVVAEAETPALLTWLRAADRAPVSCDLARTELLRAVRRVAPDRAVQVRTVLDSVTLVQVSTAMFEEAGRLDPTLLRSLDAVHLAAALALGDDLEGLVTYDERMAAAAEFNGLPVSAPA
jgi:prevent-host-death family protein